MIDLQHVNFLTIPTGEAILDIGATQDLIGETALRSVEMHFDFPVPEELATKYNLDKGAFQYMLSPSPYEKGGSDTNLRPTNMTKFASATTFEHEPNERDSRLTCPQPALDSLSQLSSSVRTFHEFSAVSQLCSL